MGNGPAPPVPRLGIGPYNWNTECLRGDAEAPGWATAFPQALGLAAAFRYRHRGRGTPGVRDVVPRDGPAPAALTPPCPLPLHSPELVYLVANATATEVRAKHNDFAATGRYGDHTGLSCFSPVLNIMRHPLWGRNQVPAWGVGGDVVVTPGRGQATQDRGRPAGGWQQLLGVPAAGGYGAGGPGGDPPVPWLGDLRGGPVPERGAGPQLRAGAAGPASPLRQGQRRLQALQRARGPREHSRLQAQLRRQGERDGAAGWRAAPRALTPLCRGACRCWSGTGVPPSCPSSRRACVPAPTASCAATTGTEHGGGRAGWADRGVAGARLAGLPHPLSDRINGVPACANKKLLTDILRGEWGFEGYVVSDEGALELIMLGHHYTRTFLETAVGELAGQARGPRASRSRDGRFPFSPARQPR